MFFFEMANTKCGFVPYIEDSFPSPKHPNPIKSFHLCSTLTHIAKMGSRECENKVAQINLVKVFKELVESEPKACPKHQRVFFFFFFFLV